MLEQRRGFNCTARNTYADLWVRDRQTEDRGSLGVLVVNGNNIDFDGALRYASCPAWIADAFVCVRQTDTEQARYRRAPHDPADDAEGHHWTDSDREHTSRVVHGLKAALLADGLPTEWLLVAFSGGCVTAVRLAHELLEADVALRGLVADSGVPGSEPSLPPKLLVTLFRYTAPTEYWQGGDILREWQRRCFLKLYDQPYEGPSDRHAQKVTATCMSMCLDWCPAVVFFLSWLPPLSQHKKAKRQRRKPAHTSRAQKKTTSTARARARCRCLSPRLPPPL